MGDRLLSGGIKMKTKYLVIELFSFICASCLAVPANSAPIEAPKQRALRSGTGESSCNQKLDRCFIPVYVLPPNVSPDSMPASTNCSTWVEHKKTIAAGRTTRVVWIIVEAVVNDPAKYRFVMVPKAIALDDETGFSDPDVEDSGTRHRFKWKLRNVHGESNYRILVESSTDNWAHSTPCDVNDPFIVNGN
jgi:hypothetical protein